MTSYTCCADKWYRESIISTHSLISFRDLKPSFPMERSITILISHDHESPLSEDKFLLVGCSNCYRRWECQVITRVFCYVDIHSVDNTSTAKATAIKWTVYCFDYTPVTDVVRSCRRRRSNCFCYVYCSDGRGNSACEIPHVFDRIYHGSRSEASSSSTIRHALVHLQFFF